LSADSASRKLCYKIGEACRVLDIQPYVLRYWETEFQALAPGKSRSGQRVYTEKELGIIRRIKELLYREGYTIAGAKKKLDSEMAAGDFGEFAPEAAAEEPVSAAPAPKPAPRATVKARRAARVLDTSPDERIESLARGLRELRGEARDLLTLLRSKSSRS
jgi:DNA-binding transcriptional MerR regulator